LLLGVSVLCLLVLFPAAALSQSHSVDAGCGTATIDGHVGNSEWATAGTLPLYESDLLDAPAGPEGMHHLRAGASQLRLGTAYFMNDGRFLYLGAKLNDPNGQIPDDPDYFEVTMLLAFEDEPAGDPDAWVDCSWEAASCNEPEDEGVLYAETDKGLSAAELVEFIWYGHFAAPHDNCYDSPLFMGVDYRGLPQGGGAHAEMRLNLDTSPINNPDPAAGDCFDLRWLGMILTGGDADPGIFEDVAAGWPIESVDDEPYTGECTVLCLNPCEVEEVEEFVPEPGTMILFGSGLAGLAGYAALRWRSRQ
jgi:hypothetical protein